MATYVIGDVQGCFDELQHLLNVVAFNPGCDTLWFCGDIVNRGPKSLETIRFIKSLDTAAITVLGNHDLHCLAAFHGVRPLKKSDTIQDIITAPDAGALIDWLRHQPLCHIQESSKRIMLHAGVDPSWRYACLKDYASEVEQVLQTDEYINFLKHMYGNEPSHWSDNLTGYVRLRYITNVLTRIRFSDCFAHLKLTIKTSLLEAPKGCIPWFELIDNSFKPYDIYFGHWAQLGGECPVPKIHAMDTGCVWGGTLSALCLEDGKLHRVPSLART